MNRATINPVGHLLRGVVEDQRLKILLDEELLRPFSPEPDEAAFSALLRRHERQTSD
ncbi:MAG TPA: hypothetical protein VGF55_08235 [Gemmataceae bacterium]|jgi:hypothetical protein